MQTAASIAASGVMNCILLSFLYWLIGKNRIMTAKKTSMYRNVILLTVLVILCECTTTVSESLGASFRTAAVISNAIGFAVSPFIPSFISSVISENHNKPLFLLIRQGICSVMSLLSPFTGWIFSVSAENVYSRGEFFWVYIVAYAFGLAVMFISTFIELRRSVFEAKIYFSALSLVLLAGTTVQVLIPSLHTTWHSVTIVLTLYYLFHREQKFQYDSLTGLLNREAFTRALEADSRRKSVMLMMIDIDHFKTVNDTYGHSMGDKCLKRSAEAVMKVMSQLGTCYRIGGDEFCVIGSETDGEIINRYISKLEKLIEDEKKKYPYLSTLTCGYSVVSGKQLDRGWIDADRDMYRNKSKKH